MTNILILTASIGNGHNQIASNLHSRLVLSGCNVDTVDFLAVSSYDVNHLFCSLYKRILQYKPDFFRSVCRFSENSKINNTKYLLAKINRHIIYGLVQKYHPDCIICTHFFPLAAAAAYKKKYKAGFELTGVVTDYNIHPIWQVDFVDKYFVAHQSLAGQFAGHYHLAGQILPTGLPVGPDFIPAPAIRTSGNILIMTGGQTEQSLSSILAAVQALPRTTSVTFITGKNRSHRRLLQKLSATHKNYTVIGFTRQVAAFMKNCSLLITKPGGATISEALAVGLPLIAFSPIPGIEEDNARFIEENGLGLWAHTSEQLSEAVRCLLNDSDKRRMIRKRMLNLQVSKAAEYIKDDILADLGKKNKVA